MSIGRQLEHHLRYPVAIACAWETFAIMTNKVPTISKLCWKQKILIPIILGGLAAHLLIPHNVEGASVLVDFDGSVG
jgi:hypothetical protein